VPYENRRKNKPMKCSDGQRHKQRGAGGKFGYSLPSQTFDIVAAYDRWRVWMDELYA
jgi:hypothetical protein